ncbi:MAG: iron-containing alcohol dehydrogenase [Bacteroidales bacterium]|nr:iron-containing alcohol dehydrogenase [Bacteroidales bacterium]MBN2756994.1 iron-containing alcohol dehydrogenase [Bacteroidales bacterium]
MIKNIRNIDKIVFGGGSFSQLEDIIQSKRTENDKFFVFIVDDFFKGKYLEKSLPAYEDDLVFFLDASHEEPKTGQIDELRDEILSKSGLPSGIVGIGGGSIMDIAKALSVMVKQEGSSTLYQGLNLVENPGIYHVGIPTISGTGAECSTTAVLTGPVKKLGIKCEWTPFNQLILDPDLTLTVPKNQWFYTGMDSYIHCIESESGRLYNTFSKAYGDQSIELCREVFLGEDSGQSPENSEKLMVASLFGGLSLSYSEVGVCHALSYGLSYVFGTRHGIANCIAFNVLEDFYPQGVAEFKEMVRKHNIELPENLAAKWTDEQVTKMAEIAYALSHMWDHAVGENWKEKVTIDTIKDLFYRM